MREIITSGILVAAWTLLGTISIAICYGQALILNFIVKKLNIFSSRQQFLTVFVYVSGLMLIAGLSITASKGLTLSSTLMTLGPIIVAWIVILSKNWLTVRELFSPNKTAQQ